MTIAPLFGAKSRMWPFIAERLNYRDCHTYVELFGGMGNVLLNKPRHIMEKYNEINPALNALMRVLADKEKSEELIYELLDTEYSKDEFDEAVAIVKQVETDLVEESSLKLYSTFRKWLVKKKVIDYKDNRTVIKKKVKAYIRSMQKSPSADLTELKAAFDNYSKLDDSVAGDLYDVQRQKIDEHGNIERFYTDIEIAKATYIAYRFSRDGMARHFSSVKFNTSADFHKKVTELRDIAKRLSDVEIYSFDAVDFFRTFNKPKTGGTKGETEPYMIYEWLHDPNICVYCDPSYISSESEAEILEGIDVANERSLTKAIQKLNRPLPRNAGSVYYTSFDYAAQENFVRLICECPAKMMVSNYDLELYKKYLTPERGWKYQAYETFTAVGQKAGNRRMEILYYNY